MSATFNRREFLTLGATAGTAGLVGCAPTASAQDEAPPSIAALTPMTNGVVPISIDERRARLEKARGLMRTEGVDALMLTGGTSMIYFTGIRWGLSERLLAMILPRTGTPFIVAPAFEEDRAREQLDDGPIGADGEVLTWEEDEDPYRLVLDGLRARGHATGTLAMEETVRFVFADGVSNAAPGVDIVSGTPVTAGCRIIKDDHELALMRHASAITLKAYEAAYLAMQDGMTQDDVSGLIAQAHSRLGYSGGASVQTGQYAALPHGSTTPQTISEGTIVLIDGGCSVEGYRSDISRTFVLGQPTQKMKDVFAIEFEAQSAALAAARPGVPCEDVDAAARNVITDAGYGPDYTYFTHRVGHGMGMDGHEWPYLVRGNKLPLAPGMTFSDEPGIYLRGEFGVRLEDDMVITETGAELFTPQSPTLEDPFGTIA
jgi:Xaa-Pro dipeptidase